MVALSPGRIFHGRYEIVRVLKTGGMGAVYEVIHLETRRRRALKVMLAEVVDSVDLRRRFKLEATVAADIESEHIVETFDAGVDEETGAPFLVMELLRGEDLASVVERRGGLPPGDVVRLLAQAASALDKTHAAGVVHRDLKPDNLFVARRDDGSPKIKILDFGIAKVVSEKGQPAAKTKVLGTPLYMSPEQVRGDGRIGPRADLYALAQIAFTLLAGKPYWAKEHEALPLYALMTEILGGCQAPAAERAARYGGAVPPAFDAWFATATRVVPEERFASATAMVAALAEALGVAAVLPRPTAGELDARHGGSAPGARAKARVGAAERDTAVVSESARLAGVPTETLRTETDAPASLATAPSPPSVAGKRFAGATAAAAVVLAAVALTALLRGGHPPVATGTSGSPSPPPSAVTMGTSPPTSATSEVAAPVPAASASASAHVPGPPLTPTPGVHPIPRRRAAPPAAVPTAAPAPESSAPPARSLD